MAKIRGYKVIGTTSKSKEAVGKATGVDELIVLDEAPGTSYEDYSSVDVTKKVMEITGGEVCPTAPEMCVVDLPEMSRALLPKDISGKSTKHLYRVYLG